MKKLLNLLIPLFSLSLFSCQDAVRLELSRRVDVLIKDTTLYQHLWLDYDGISIYKSQAHKDLDKPECKLYYTELETFKQMWEVYSTEEILEIYSSKGISYFDLAVNDRIDKTTQIREEGSPKTPLAGKRIAIDPVHIGGSARMAMLEGKLLKIVEAGKDTVYLDEGALTLAVARIMEVKLKKLGAEVILTRQKPGISALGKDFFTWMAQDLKKQAERDHYIGNITEAREQYLINEADPLFVFNQYFKPKEMERRAKIINQFKPDAALMIRFNVHEPNWENRSSSGAMRPTEENYSMAFVPGAFMVKEMDTPIQRLEFLRLLVTDHLDESIKLSEKAMTAFQYELNVEPVAKKLGLKYLAESCSPTEIAGVDARNLYMTRRVHAPLCYGEPFCLDNIDEFMAVNKAEVKVGEDIITSLKLEEVADAYIVALRQYFQIPKPLTEDDIVEEEI